MMYGKGLFFSRTPSTLQTNHMWGTVIQVMQRVIQGHRFGRKQNLVHQVSHQVLNGFTCKGVCCWVLLAWTGSAFYFMQSVVKRKHYTGDLWSEVAQPFLVDFMREVTGKKSCKYGEYGLCEHFALLEFFINMRNMWICVLLYIFM